MSVASNGLRAFPDKSGAPCAPGKGGAWDAPYGTLESTSLHHGGNCSSDMVNDLSHWHIVYNDKQ